MATTLADRNPLPRQLARKRRSLKQRGIVLLMVVSLLALFLLMGVTFAILAIQYKTAADVQAQVERYGDPAQNEADLVLNQVLFESLQPSSLSGHGLLRDLWGNDYVQYPADFTPVNDTSYNVQVLSAANQGGGQLLQITFDTSYAYSPVTLQPAAAGANISVVPGYYNGRVLTIYASNIRQWVSTRIVQFVAATPSSSPAVARIYAEVPVGDPNLQPTFQAGDPFVINGAAFNGAGAGFDPTQTANNMEAIEGQFRLPVALLPHFAAYPVKLAYNPSDTTNGFSVEIGGADESWDAADYQNMLLSFVPPRFVTEPGTYPLIPSLHRPELLNFWMNHATTISTAAGSTVTADPTNQNGRDLLRKIVFRPMPWDSEHPNFSGSNPFFDRNRGVTVQQMLNNLRQSGGWNAVWDVDNDGDGVRDSIWVDPGLPVMTSQSGRRYKRLVAILVKDLDGRVNINATGNLYFATDANARAVNPLTTSAGSPAFLVAGQGPGGSVNLPRGFGYGPAEIDFCNILGGYGSASGVYNNILLGRYRSNSDATGRPGLPTTDDPFSAVKTLGMPRPNGNHTSELSLYSTPPDVWGRGAVALDYFGQPAWQNMGTDEVTDDPYEMQFDPRTAVDDSPYGPADQEHLLRYPDADSASINSRLLNASVAGSVMATSPPGQINAQEHVRRESLTVNSYHIGGPRSFWRNDGRITSTGGSTRVRQGINVLDLYYQRLSGVSNFNQQWRTIVPFELQHGEAFNLNRLFGNGSQDATTTDNYPAGDVRALIDDPSESPYGLEKIFGSYDFDHHNDDPSRAPISSASPPASEPFPLNARITYARHLYCLLMLIKSQSSADFNVDADGDGTSGTSRDTARVLAQYAVNVVDFRDNDSIHTGFEYDVFPFDGTGWDVDGYLSTTNDPAAATNSRGVVWGAERPEVLITEALAFHDRRTEDLSVGAMGSEETTVAETDPDKKDNDYDQRVRPKGRMFFELFNPWVDRTNNAYDHKPSELYTNGGVRLHATVRDRNPTMRPDPVWRVVVVRGQSNVTNADPDLPQPGAIGATNDVDRTVYFANPNDATNPLPPGWVGDSGNRRYYPDIDVSGTRNNFAPLMPGRYAIVGSAGMQIGNGYTSHVGRSVPADDAQFAGAMATSRRLVITPSPNANVQQFQVMNNDPTTDANSADYYPAIGIPINMPRSLNVTEPLAGYESMIAAAGTSVWTPGTVPDEPTSGGVAGGSYNPAIDTPLDKTRRDNPIDAADAADAALLLQDKTEPSYRTLHLQRLANPTIQWHPQINPYITIDTSSLDLTVFNGLVSDADDPDNPSPPPPGRLINFQSFQRGGGDANRVGAGGGFAPARAATDPIRNLWAMEPPHTASNQSSPAEGAGTTHVFPRMLVHTLGYLNIQYEPGIKLSSPPPHAAYVGAPDARMPGPNNKPFSGLVINNRPFMSPIELLQVPGKSPSQLLRTYSVTDGVTATNPYTSTQAIDPLFAHLANFFQTNAAPGNFANVPLLARIMDYVETPSPFVGSERFYNPQYFNSTASPGANVPTSTYRPPFGKLSRFRDPGRINLNTIAEPEVWRSLVSSFPTWSDHTAVFQSRQGYSSGLFQISGNFPSIFSNPFRAAEAADLMPNVSTVLDLRQRETDATLLRRNTLGVSDNTKPLLAATTTAATPHNDAGRSPFHRYHPLQKIANNVTTNSNCYGVWITVGYFEVEDAGTVDAAHPDGYMLGQELGLDMGDTQRHRSFYLIDRSIPVGFIPGMKLNADNCVLLRRQID